jgi:hypothetical protein
MIILKWKFIHQVIQFEHTFESVQKKQFIHV